MKVVEGLLRDLVTLEHHCLGLESLENELGLVNLREVRHKGG